MIDFLNDSTTDISKQFGETKKKIWDHRASQEEINHLAESALTALENILCEADYEGYVTVEQVREELHNLLRHKMIIHND